MQIASRVLVLVPLDMISETTGRAFLENILYTSTHILSRLIVGSPCVIITGDGSDVDRRAQDQASDSGVHSVDRPHLHGKNVLYTLYLKAADTASQK